jgi:hypothetical protein
VYKLIPNLQTIKAKSITIKPKSSLAASPISISPTRRGNRGRDFNKTADGRAREKEKEKLAYLVHNGGKQSAERDAEWNRGLPSERGRGRMKKKKKKNPPFTSLPTSTRF